MAGIENSVASITPRSSAGKMSAAASSWVDTPSFCMTLAPSPKKRIFRPFISSRFLISLRNQPEVSGPMQKQSKAIEIVLGVDLVAQLVAAAEPLPGQELADVGAERHRREEGERGILAGVVAGRRPARLYRALGDRIEAFQRRHDGAGLEELHLELAPGHALDVLGEAHGRWAEVGERAGECARHFPAHAILGIGRGGHQHERGGRRAHDSRFEQAFRHMAVLPSSPKDIGAGRRRTLRSGRLQLPAGDGTNRWGFVCAS